MGKVIKMIIAITIIAVIYQFVVVLFLNQHDIEYSILSDDNSFFIHEKFNKNGDNNIYSFKITKDKEEYVFSYNEDLNKQERIIKNIKYYQSGDISCVYPIFKNNKGTNNITCLKENQLFSNTALLDNDDSNYKNILSNLNNDGYKVKSIENGDLYMAQDNINVNVYSNIKNTHVALWRNSGIFLVMGKKKVKDYNVLDFADYNNTYSYLVERYYVTPDYKDGRLNRFFIINIKDGGKSYIEAPNEDTSANFYINGVINDRLYYTDVKDKKQYIIYPFDKSFKETSPKEYKNNKFVDISIDDLTKTEIKFVEDNIPEKLKNKLGNVEIIKSNQNYYYTKNNEVYVIIGNNYDNPVLLFTLPDFSKMKVSEDYVYGVSENSLYVYNFEEGLRKLVDYDGLKGNNSYEIYRS